MYITWNAGQMAINVQGDLTLDQLNLAVDMLKAQLLARIQGKGQIGGVEFRPRVIG